MSENTSNPVYKLTTDSMQLVLITRTIEEWTYLLTLHAN